jgi:hypothetical protein
VTVGPLKAQGATLYAMQVSAVSAGRFQATVVMAPTKESLHKNLETIQSILSTVEFIEGEKPGGTTPAPSSAGAFRADLFGTPNDVAGFYFGYRVGVSSGSDLGARGSNLLLYKDCTYTYLFPTGGFDTYDLAAQKQAQPGSFHR